MPTHLFNHRLTDQPNRELNEPKLKEECGVMGVFHHPKAAQSTCIGLHALQHRGQESAGITTFAADGSLHQYKGMGLVEQVFDQSSLQQLPGGQAIGHVRYSTSGTSELKNAQPISGLTPYGLVTLAHNGNLTNAQQLRLQMEQAGHRYQTNVDTEVILQLINVSSHENLEAALVATLLQLEGAFSLVIMTPNRLYGIRDPHGFRPLVLGRSEAGSYVLASETCALDQINGISYQRDILPGELVSISREGVQSTRYATAQETFCAFELIYFARPNSQLQGQNMYQLRRELGRQLARQISSPVDLVIPVPDSGVPAAIGVAEALNLLFQHGLVKNNYSGRTFILPEAMDRRQKVRTKLNLISDLVRGKRVLVVDDSLVRGTTSQVICQMLRAGGAAEVHLAISSPPVKYPCHYGIDITHQSQLIAADKSVSAIGDELGVNSLTYLPLEEMKVLLERKGFACCTACFERQPTATK